jgi:hypothetical protein
MKEAHACVGEGNRDPVVALTGVRIARSGWKPELDIRQSYVLQQEEHNRKAICHSRHFFRLYWDVCVTFPFGTV